MNSVGERRNEMKCDGEAIDRRLSGDIARLHHWWMACISQDNIRVMDFQRKIDKNGFLEFYQASASPGFCTVVEAFIRILPFFL